MQKNLKKPIMKIMNPMKTIKYLCLALSLCGCYTPHKALKELNKANDLQPKVVADYVGEHFPCKIKSDSIVKTDTLYQYIDVVCPIVDSLTKGGDTIYLDKIKVVNKTKIVKQVVGIPSKSVTITKYYEDSAKIKSLTLANSQTQASLTKCQGEKEKKSEWIKWLIICLCLSILLNIIQVRK